MSGDHIPYAEGRSSQARALEAAVPSLREQVSGQQENGRFRGPGPVFVAIGASFAAASAPVWTLRNRGIHAWRLVAGDYPLPFPVSSHPLIGISQSGRSTETLDVLASVERPLRYVVTNARRSPLAAAADAALWLGDVPDSFASTIGYTATLVGLGMIADAWDGGAIDPTWDVLPEVVADLERSTSARSAELAVAFLGRTTADVVGGGPAIGSAEAGALLFREVARVPAAALSTRQYLHGPMESAGSSVHVLIGDTREIEVARTLSEAGHPVILITAATVSADERLQVVRLPAFPPSPRAVLEAVVMQVIAGAVAEQAGVDIDAFVFHNADTKVVDPAPASAR